METRRRSIQSQHTTSESSICRWGFVCSMLSLNAYVPAGKADEKENWDSGGI